MKKTIAFLLSLVMLCTLTMPALAAAAAGTPVTPTPPSWMDEEDYLVIPDDPVYLEENWKLVSALRAEAEKGALEPNEEIKKALSAISSAGRYYELSLIWMKCAENAGVTTTKGQKDVRNAQLDFRSAGSAWKKVSTEEKEQDLLYGRLCLCAARAYLLGNENYKKNSYNESVFCIAGSEIVDIMSILGMTMDDIYDAPYLEQITPGKRYVMFDRLCDYCSDLDLPVPVSSKGDIQIFVDGSYIRLDVAPEVVKGRTMLPIRAVAEALGAKVGWDKNTRQVTLTRAGDTVVMTVGSRTATLNGKALKMSVAPLISGNRTLIPVRYVAKFFGQNVEWDPETRRVFITEDKSVAGSSNLEAWAIPMGMLLGLYNGGDPTQFGFGRNAKNAAAFRKLLGDPSWGIESREDLIATILSMTLNGHNLSFYQEVAYAMSLSDEEMKELVAESNDVGKYMWPYVRTLGEKWGDRGVINWDLFRMVSLAEMGYTAGYLTYEEALALIWPCAEILSANFSSWDEAYQNYIDGYIWWSRTDLDKWQKDNTDIEKYQAMEAWEDWMWEPRGDSYCELKSNPETAGFFNDGLFQTGVVPLPDDE